MGLTSSTSPPIRHPRSEVEAQSGKIFQTTLRFPPLSSSALSLSSESHWIRRDVSGGMCVSEWHGQKMMKSLTEFLKDFSWVFGIWEHCSIQVGDKCLNSAFLVNYKGTRSFFCVPATRDPMVEPTVKKVAWASVPVAVIQVHVAFCPQI